MDVAVRLMSKNGHSGASLREIAAEVGINAASIYNRFKSKNEIIMEMLDFSEETQDMFLPDLYSLLDMCKTNPIKEIMDMLNFYYHPAVQETMDRIMVIATMEFRSNERCKEFIQKRLLSFANSYTRPVLLKLIELERIEPMDVEGFIILLNNFCCSGGTRNFSPLAVSMEEWLKGLETLHSLIRSTGK